MHDFPFNYLCKNSDGSPHLGIDIEASRQHLDSIGKKATFCQQKKPFAVEKKIGFLLSTAVINADQTSEDIAQSSIGTFFVMNRTTIYTL